MGIENHGDKAESGQESSGKERVADIEKKLARLKILSGTLQMEEKAQYATRGAVRGAEAGIQSASDRYIEESMKGEASDEALAERENAHQKLSEAQEHAEIYRDENLTTQFKDGVYNSPKLEDGALAENLKELGVDVASDEVKAVMRATPGDNRVLIAVEERIAALTKELNEARLDTPGGKDIMTVELLKKRSALDDDLIARLKLDYRNHVLSEDRDDIKSAMTKNLMNRISHVLKVPEYPIEVQKSAAEQVARQAFGDTDREKITKMVEEHFASMQAEEQDQTDRIARGEY